MAKKVPQEVANTNGSAPVRTRPQIRSQLAIGYDGALRSEYATSRWYRKVREMRRDPTIALVRRLIAAPVLIAPWSVESIDGAPDGAQEYIEQQILPQRRHLLRTGLLGCIDFGWQPYETVISSAGDLLKVKALLQDITQILVFRDTGAYAGLRQPIEGTNEEIDLEIFDSLLLHFDVEGTDWYGQSTLANAEGPYDRTKENDDAAKKYINKVAGAHFVVHYPVGTSVYNGVEKDNFLIAWDLLNKLEASGHIVVPDVEGALKELEVGWRIELLSDSGASHDTLLERSMYLDKLKVRAFGFPERSILEGEFGTKAEAGEHGSFAISMMEQRHMDIVDLLNWHLVNRLLIYAYGPQAEDTVFVTPSPIADQSLLLLKEIYLALLSNTDTLMEEFDIIDREAMRDQLGVPARPENERPDLPTMREVGEDLLNFATS